jgi:hypothetical protein
MTDPQTSRIDLAQVLERFPADTAIIGRLLEHDETFLSVCEDYSLAAATLARLVTSPHTAKGVEIDEYRSLVSDLAHEIEEALSNAR